MLKKSQGLADMMRHLSRSPEFEFEDIIVALELQIAALLVEYGSGSGLHSGLLILVKQIKVMAEKLIEIGSTDFNDIDLDELANMQSTERK